MRLKRIRMNAVLVLLVAAGCSGAGERPTALDARLARLERHRFATERSTGVRSFGDSGGSVESTVSHDRLAIARADGRRSVQTGDSSRRGIAASNPPDAFAWNASDMSLTLSDIVDDTPSPATADADWAHDREVRFLRRPPLDSFWETLKRDVRQMPRELWRDTKLVYGNPVNLVILGSAYGGSLALQETGPDDSVEDHFRGGHHHFNEDWRDAFGAAGNPGIHFALAGVWYLAGQQAMDDKTYDVGKTMFSALIINGVTVMLGQAASSDRSPNGEWGTFPSGHTSSSFVMASVLDRAYGHVVGVPLYGLATLVAAERVEDGEHYLSDVVMGGVLGLVIGHTVAGGREPEFYGWKVVPFISPESSATGVGFVKSFK